MAHLDQASGIWSLPRSQVMDLNHSNPLVAYALAEVMATASTLDPSDLPDMASDHPAILIQNVLIKESQQVSAIIAEATGREKPSSLSADQQHRIALIHLLSSALPESAREELNATITSYAAKTSFNIENLIASTAKALTDRALSPEESTPVSVQSPAGTPAVTGSPPLKPYTGERAGAQSGQTDAASGRLKVPSPALSLSPSPTEPPDQRELDQLLAAAISSRDPLDHLVATEQDSNPHMFVAKFMSRYTVDPTIVIDLGHRYSADPYQKALAEAVPLLRHLANTQHNMAINQYLEALGRWTGFQIKDPRKAELLRERRREMPPIAPASGEYWDVASGVTSRDLIWNELQPGVQYRFFDRSPYVTGYLNALIARAGVASHAQAGTVDILKLPVPDQPIRALRAKNAITYAPGFARKLYAWVKEGWIAPGGKIILQADSFFPAPRKGMIKAYEPMALRLLEQGWELSVDFSIWDPVHMTRKSTFAYDTIVLTRPAEAAQARTPEEARALWRKLTHEA